MPTETEYPTCPDCRMYHDVCDCVGPERSIEATIQQAIDRAGEAWEEANEEDIMRERGDTRWRFYAAELDDMGRNWSDRYPLAVELAQLRWTSLASLWKDLTG